MSNIAKCYWITRIRTEPEKETLCKHIVQCSSKQYKIIINYLDIFSETEKL